MIDETKKAERPDYSHMSREHRLMNLLADEMLDTLTNGYKTIAGDEVVRAAPPASYMNVVRQFLKDNLKPDSKPFSLSALLDPADQDRVATNLPFPSTNAKKPN